MTKSIQKEYEKDFYAWSIHNAKLLREGKLSEIDVENIAEEIESMGKRERRELINRFAILIAHLLKWEYQPARRSKSWECTIREQRFELVDLLEESPSLKHEIEEQLAHAYKKSLIIAEKETGFALNTFPKACSFSLKQILTEQ
jgi:vacuolar-type H+-ATPase subunit C/Vma6